MFVTNVRTGIQNKKYEAVLKKRRDDLARKVNYRLGDVSVDHEPDDEGDVATRNFAKDLAVVTLERERNELAEVEAALSRILRGGYGICEVCENPIREARLQALPWARLCIQCADRGTSANAAD
ncbi:MAG: TraR/DksA family transcriptional regulator [Candidatus Acidiferrales bacterium]